LAQVPGYPVDLVLCIDATGSMTPIIDQVKRSAQSFHDDLRREMDAKGKVIDSLRVRVVVFRDLNVDGDQALSPSPFFALPEQAAAFSECVGAIYADGGGDEPESGLEALAVAIASPWSTEGVKRRQVIVVWTDASAHALNGSAGSAPHDVQAAIPANFDDLTDLWEDQSGPMNPTAKRLILYAPDAYPWTDISNHWKAVIHHVSRGGSGLSDIDYRTILDVIAQSV
jgi:hypothetical protein